MWISFITCLICSYLIFNYTNDNIEIIRDRHIFLNYPAEDIDYLCLSVACQYANDSCCYHNDGLYTHMYFIKPKSQYCQFTP